MNTWEKKESLMLERMVQTDVLFGEVIRIDINMRNKQALVFVNRYINQADLDNDNPIVKDESIVVDLTDKTFSIESFLTDIINLVTGKG